MPCSVRRSTPCARNARSAPARGEEQEVRRAARAQRGRSELAWGDVRDTDFLAGQLHDVDAVIHLAGLLPPATENQRELAGSAA